jgi:type VI secretion system protein ImpJ
MKLLSKFVWSEGMYLAPHHFQAQNRYFEDSVHFATANLWSAGYGFTSYSLDVEGIRNGTVALLTACGIFQDGLPFDMPECDALPAARNIGALFPPAAESLTVYLAVPQHAPDGPNCTLETDLPERDTRFIGLRQIFPDENTGRDEKPVFLGRKNIRLLLETEDCEGLLRMPLARVIRDASGHYVFDPDFIPPCLKLVASDRLLGQLRRLVDILEEKSASVARSQPRLGDKFQAGMSAAQVAQFWLLHSINSSLAPLRHALVTKHGHPEEAYREMLRLGGALCTFALDSHPRTLPVYDHDHLDQCFDALDDHIRRHLEIVAPSQAILIPLTPGERYFYNGNIKDDRCIARSRWILGIRSAVGEAELIFKTPQLVKVCSAKFVPELVKRALPGLTLTHLTVPPPAIAARVDMQYFSVSKAGPCWEHIAQSKQVGVYVPGELPRPEMELTVLLES